MRLLKNFTVRRGATRLQCFALIAGGVCLATPLKLGIVNGTSMEPTLSHGQMYLMDRTRQFRQEIKRGDVVVFRKDHIAYVKRVAAGPGDVIYLLRTPGDGDDLVVTTFQLPRLQRAIKNLSWSRSHKLIRRQIPPGYYYVLGDNRNVSIDSREFGLVRKEEILGHVLFVPQEFRSGETLAGHFVAQPRS